MVQLLEALVGEMPVLAMFAPQVATRTGKTQPKMAGDEMVERRFFNWANIYNRRFPINNGIEFPFLVFSVSTKASLTFTDDAFSRADKTSNSFSFLFFIEHCFPYSAFTVTHVLFILQIKAMENRDSDANHK